MADNLLQASKYSPITRILTVTFSRGIALPTEGEKLLKNIVKVFMITFRNLRVALEEYEVDEEYYLFKNAIRY